MPSSNQFDINLSDYVGANDNIIEINRIFQFQARAADFNRKWQYYNGKGIPRPLRRKHGQPDHNVRLNLMRLVADKAVAFLFGKDFDLSLDGEGLETDVAEEWLIACWQANNKMTLLQEAALFGALTGHCFISIVLDPTQEYPRLQVLDPSIVDIVVSPDNRDEIQQFIIEYPRRDETTGKPGSYKKVIERAGPIWSITEWAKFGGGNWQIIDEDKWPYPFAPIIACPNLPAPGCVWGLADITDDLIDLNNSLNSVYSDLKKIVSIHSSPKTWAKGVNVDELKFGIDSTIVLPNEKSEMGLLEMSASGIAPALDLAIRLKDAIHEMSHTPEVDPAKLGNIGALSGLALQILYQPLLERTELKRVRYGWMIQELSRRLLVIAGYRYGYGAIPRLTWPDVLPKDPQAESLTTQTLDQLGLASKQTLAAKFGLNYSDELARMEVEAKRQMLLIQLEQVLSQEDRPSNVKQ